MRPVRRSEDGDGGREPDEGREGHEERRDGMKSIMTEKVAHGPPRQRESKRGFGRSIMGRSAGSGYGRRESRVRVSKLCTSRCRR